MKRFYDVLKSISRVQKCFSSKKKVEILVLERSGLKKNLKLFQYCEDGRTAKVYLWINTWSMRGETIVIEKRHT